ncbi:hypothetical protein AVO42_02900 [Thiomicrospira sp. XS5]|uniref:SPOR domain-containing protein n=1 Tax=Thiomicrospira sp. XS5 TaxID=1775636 RepID=UPI00074881B0|nr:SPOR domain-containing protein [Thiomicrospira sp. XS5]KUJ74375.1 hypothetical protein AVO42_02900 [Thiomicrospira sp. XS5]
MRQYTRDYRHGHSQPRQTYQRKSQMAEPETEAPQTSSRWVWGLALLLSVALFGGFFVVQHFAHHGVKSESQVAEVVETVTESVSPEQPAEETNVSAEETAEEAADAPLVVESLPVGNAQAEMETPLQYTFYDGLAKTEVVVDVEPISVKLNAPYYIQAGTFGTRDVAQKEQARLKSHGQDLTISTVTWKGRVYYRLRVGPYDDRLEMNKKRNELRSLGVDTLLIKSRPKSDG